MEKQKIFCIGLSRSGTTSLNYALKQLGFKSLHFPFQLYFDKHSSLISNADAFSDTPIPMIYQELDQLYPGSKFILTKRNKEAWLNSMEWLFKDGKVKWWWGYHVHEYHMKFYGTKKFDREILSKKYDLFHDEVASYFAKRPQDLLELDLDQGVDIKNLCYFLNIPEKSITFPKRNAKASVPLKRKIAYKIYSMLLFSPKLVRNLKKFVRTGHGALPNV